MLLLLFIKHIKTIYMIDFFYSEKIKIPMYEAFMWNGEQFKTMLPGGHHIIWVLTPFSNRHYFFVNNNALLL